MVRREEQAWDPSASILLDSRAGAHAGRGMHNSIEWAVSAAASIAMHFLDDGFSVEIYEADGPLHISGSLGPAQLRLGGAGDEPADRPAGRGRPRRCTTRSRRPTIDRPGQLVVAILGRMTAEDANSLLRVRRNRAQGLAMVLDVDTFADDAGGDPQSRRQHELADQILRDNQWRVVEVRTRHERRRGLGRTRAAGSGGLMRATDRTGRRRDRRGLSWPPSPLRPLTSDSSLPGAQLAADPAARRRRPSALRRLGIGAGLVLAVQALVLVGCPRSCSAWARRHRRGGLVRPATSRSGRAGSSTCRPSRPRWTPNAGVT